MIAIVCVLLIVFSVVLCVGYAVSSDVETEEISFNENDPVKIAHLSDIHYPRSFLSLNELASLVEKNEPDCVVLTGDVADGNASKTEISDLSPFFNRLVKLCPCFLTIGNHEIGSEYLDRFINIAKEAGITVLNNEISLKTINGREFAFIGLSDGYPYEEKTFENKPVLTGKTKILLSHRPEKIDEYSSAPETIRPDYVFAGHAHGGIMRLGKLALYAPDQGFFPKYTSGLYEKNGVKMIVSRGLGISGTDFRFLNEYHLPVIII